MRVAWLALFAVGCLEADLYEATCDNGLDDDRDGQIDCEDLDCVEAQRCEDSFDRCRDGLDNDADGRADCSSPSCVEGGFCEPFRPEAGCDVRRQTGCPSGMGCWRDPTDSEPRCATLMGASGEHGDPCDGAIPVSGGCRPDAYCTGGLCRGGCSVQSDCGPDSLCTGVCTLRCEPTDAFVPCPAGFECVAVQTLSDVVEPALPEGGLFGCYERTELVPEPWGDGEVGDECGRGNYCRQQLVCVPALGGALSCRETCMWDPRSGLPASDCSGGGRCWPVYPSHPALRDPEVPLILGTCWPEGAR